ncbi:hypothetical protein [Aureibaculum luteum]|uniref:hypothetical protein n=1 Tax=Aureibaculum luteum TaxID=1548456 RepID=UPI000E509D62|nr:hypothetical protein [Aureibaculum luteum]
MQKLLKFFNVTKLFVFLNYGALLVGVLNTYLRPKFFSQYFSEQNFAFLTITYGLAVYIGFLDGGISKPLYVSLREKFINKKDGISQQIKQTFSFYLILFAIVLLIFSFVLLFFYYQLQNNLSLILIFLLVFNLTVNFQISNFKNILLAVDEFEFFQKIEFFRRISNLLAICSLVIDTSFILGVLLSNVIIVVLLLFLKKKLNQKYNLANRFLSIKWLEITTFYRQYFEQSKNFFQFTVFETIIYNSGFIIIPFFYDDFNIIQYGLLITIFNGISIFSRSIVDISIHEMTKTYLADNLKKSKKIFHYSLLISLIMNLLIFLVFIIFSEFIFDIWVGQKYIFTQLMYLALFIMLMGNAIQHVSGTILVSLKNNFKKVKLISRTILIIVLLAQFGVIIVKGNISLFYFMTSIIYFFGAIAYFYSALSLYKAEK